MAEQERLTNKERKAQARAERKEREAREAQQRKRASIRNGLLTAVAVAVVAAVVLQAFMGGPETVEDQILVAASEVEDARSSAGCEVLTERQPLPDSSHFEAAQTPPGSQIWTDTRPTHSGPHTVSTHPVVGSSSSQIDEASSTHNLEHGAIIVWYDPEQVDEATAEEMGAWAERLNDSGFQKQGGGGIMVSPYTDPGIASGKAIAVRAWGTAMDCDAWDEQAANGFVLEHYGTNGISPERAFSEFPTDVMAYEDGEAPAGSDGGEQPAEGDTTGGDEASGDESGSDG